MRTFAAALLILAAILGVLAAGEYWIGWRGFEIRIEIQITPKKTNQYI